MHRALPVMEQCPLRAQRNHCRTGTCGAQRLRCCQRFLRCGHRQAGQRLGFRLIRGHIVTQRQHSVGQRGRRGRVQNRDCPPCPRNLQRPHRRRNWLLQLGHEHRSPADQPGSRLDIRHRNIACHPGTDNDGIVPRRLFDKDIGRPGIALIHLRHRRYDARLGPGRQRHVAKRVPRQPGDHMGFGPGHGRRHRLIGPFATRPQGKGPAHDGFTHFRLPVRAVCGVSHKNAQNNHAAHRHASGGITPLRKMKQP